MKTVELKFILSGFVSLIALTLAGPAQAACTMPSGAPDAQAGDLAYNVDDAVMQYCNGTNWIAMGATGTMPTCADGEILQYDDPGDEWDCVAASVLADNLGNHTATANIQLGSHWLSGDGGNEGVTVDASGNVGVGVTPSHKLHVAGNVGAAAGAYVNFGATSGSGGYGVRDNAGVLECKDSGGSWGACGSTLSNCTNNATGVCKLQATRSSADPDFIAANIKSGVNIFGVTGTYVPPSCPATTATCTGASSALAGYTCKTIKDAIPASTTGVYWIKPSTTAFQAYCDMTNDGGGWTLVVNQGNTRAHISASEVASWSSISTTNTTDGKYSDAVINAIMDAPTAHSRIRVTGATGSSSVTINYSQTDVYFWSITTWSATSASTGGVGGNRAHTTYDPATGNVSGATESCTPTGYVGVGSCISSWPCHGGYGFTSGGTCGGNASSYNGWVYSCGDCAPGENSPGAYMVWAK